MTIYIKMNASQESNNNKRKVQPVLTNIDPYKTNSRYPDDNASARYIPIGSVGLAGGWLNIPQSTKKK